MPLLEAAFCSEVGNAILRSAVLRIAEALTVTSSKDIEEDANEIVPRSIGWESPSTETTEVL